MRSEAEGHRCELNNATHEGNENELKENPDYEYRGTKVTMIIFLDDMKKLHFYVRLQAASSINP